MNFKNILLIIVTMTVLGILPTSYANHFHGEKLSIESYDSLNGYKDILSKDLDQIQSTANPKLTNRLKAETRATVRVDVFTSKDFSFIRKFGKINGSGFIIDNKECLVMTNHHVINKSAVIKVTYISGYTQFGEPIESISNANIIGIPDKENDLALLKLDHCNNTFWAPIGDSDKVNTGEKVTIIGSPDGLNWTVSQGIVSNPKQHMDNYAAWAYIQTDGHINKGNSGGPMFNTKGEVIGINSMNITHDGFGGLGFARPANIMRLFLRNIHLYGRLINPILGVTIKDISENKAKVLGIPNLRSSKYKQYKGTEIYSIEKNAQNSGLELGDIIIDFNNVPIFNIFHFIREIDKTLLKQKVPVRVARNGKDYTFYLTLENSWDKNNYNLIATPYINSMGWDLEINPSKYSGINIPVITGAAILSPAFRNISLYKENTFISSKFDKPFGFPEEYIKEFSKNGIKLPNTKESRQTFIAINAVHAQGLDKLDLNLVPINERIKYLERYINNAQIKGLTIVAEFLFYSKIEILEVSPEFIFQDTSNIFNDNSIVQDSFYKILEMIETKEPIITANYLWIEYFLKSYSE